MVRAHLISTALVISIEQLHAERKCLIRNSLVCALATNGCLLVTVHEVRVGLLLLRAALHYLESHMLRR